ncbi:MAG: hypothetical protein CVU05_14630, partial [Bacteroidetes bacterium HGW-Bacteroidetes-21]
MNIIVVLSLSLLFTVTLFAGEPIRKTLALDKREQLVSLFNSKNEGFIIVTSNFSENKESDYLKVQYYKTNLELNWEKRVPLKNNMSIYIPIPSVEVVYSQYTNYFYLIETLSSKDKDKSKILNITQLDYSGNIKGFEFKYNVDEGDGELCLGIASTKNYLNIYTLKNDNIIMDRYKHIDLSSNNIVLPKTGAKYPKNNHAQLESYWHLGAAAENAVYFIRNRYDGHTGKKENSFEYMTFSVDEDGLLIDSISLKPNLNNKYPISLAKSIFPGLYINMFQTYGSGQPAPSEKFGSTFIYVYTVGNLEFDFENKVMYLTGLMKNNPSSNTSGINKADGYFAVKYDLKGNKISEVINDFEPDFKKQVSSYPSFRVVQYKNDLLYIVC